MEAIARPQFQSAAVFQSTSHRIMLHKHLAVHGIEPLAVGLQVCFYFREQTGSVGSAVASFAEGEVLASDGQGTRYQPGEQMLLSAMLLVPFHPLLYFIGVEAGMACLKTCLIRELCWSGLN